jgi:hypothetical protein
MLGNVVLFAYLVVLFTYLVVLFTYLVVRFIYLIVLLTYLKTCFDRPGMVLAVLLHARLSWHSSLMCCACKR